MTKKYQRIYPFISHLALLLGLFTLLGGCAVSPPMVDPYSTLLPAGRKVSDSHTRLSPAHLKRETAYLVVGANFVTYAEVWKKFDDQSKSTSFANLAYSSDTLQYFSAQWSPTRVTSMVVTELQKHFRKIVVVNDLAEAHARNARWIVMFDHAYVQTSTASATWSNTTTIDLLDSSFRRVLSASHTENSSHGLAWSNADAKRFMRLRGEDILRTVNTTLAQFRTKMSSAR